MFQHETEISYRNFHFLIKSPQYINILISTFLDDFPKVSDHTPKISQDSPNIVRRTHERFQTVFGNFWRSPKITKDIRGRSEYVLIIHLTEGQRVKNDIKNFTCYLKWYRHRQHKHVYRFATTWYTTKFYIIKSSNPVVLTAYCFFRRAHFFRGVAAFGISSPLPSPPQFFWRYVRGVV